MPVTGIPLGRENQMDVRTQQWEMYKYHQNILYLVYPTGGAHRPRQPTQCSRSCCGTVTLHRVGFITGDHSLSSLVRMKWFVQNVETWGCLGLKVCPVARQAKTCWSMQWLKSKEIHIKYNKKSKHHWLFWNLINSLYLWSYVSVCSPLEIFDTIKVTH